MKDEIPHKNPKSDLDRIEFNQDFDQRTWKPCILGFLLGTGTTCLLGSLTLSIIANSNQVGFSLAGQIILVVIGIIFSGAISCPMFLILAFLRAKSIITIPIGILAGLACGVIAAMMLGIVFFNSMPYELRDIVFESMIRIKIDSR